MTNRGAEPGHLVTDATGERERSAFVGYIEKTNPCRVVFLQDFGYAFMSDDWVSFKVRWVGVKGHQKRGRGGLIVPARLCVL